MHFFTQIHQLKSVSFLLLAQVSHTTLTIMWKFFMWLMAVLSTLLCFSSVSKFFILWLHLTNPEILIWNSKDFQKIVAHTKATGEQIKLVYTLKKIIYMDIHSITFIIVVLLRQLFKYARTQLTVQELLIHTKTFTEERRFLSNTQAQMVLL